MDSYTIASRSNQDYVGTGRVGNIDYIFAFDGHGTNNVINQIRDMNMDEIATSSDPVQAVHSRLVGNTIRSGATMAFARMTGTFVETFNCGDSTVQVWLNGSNVYTSTPHDFLNPAEIERTKHLVKWIHSDKAPFPVSPTRIEDIMSSIGYFKGGESMVPSQALGHNNITELAPETFKLQTKPIDVVRMVVSSDGFSDMLVDASTGTARVLAEEAHRRWHQKWDYPYQGRIVKNDFGGDVDDVGVAVYDNTIKYRPVMCIPWSPSHFDTDDIYKTFDAVFQGVSHVDEVVRADHKVFFIHFVPSDLDEVHKKIYEKSSFRVYYSDDWYWTTRIYNKSPPLRCVDDVYARWEGDVPWKEFSAEQIPSEICRKMIAGLWLKQTTQYILNIQFKHTLF